MIITITYPQIGLIIAHLLLLMLGLSTFKDMTSSSSTAGFIGLALWLAIGAALEVLIWLSYFSIMYLFFT